MKPKTKKGVGKRQPKKPIKKHEITVNQGNKPKTEVEKPIKLTAKQERFCYEYCIDLNATQASIRSGYSIKTAKVIGYENLTKPYIQSRVKEMQDNLAETCGITAMRIIKEHQKIAFFDAGKLRDGWMKLKEFEALSDEDKSCIQEISTKETKQKVGKIVQTETWVKIKTYDKQKSLDSITDILGLKAPTRTELTGKDGKPLIPSLKIEIINSASQVKNDDTGS
jgi:phage terminase small subunit